MVFCLLLQQSKTAFCKFWWVTLLGYQIQPCKTSTTPPWHQHTHRKAHWATSAVVSWKLWSEVTKLKMSTWLRNSLKFQISASIGRAWRKEELWRPHYNWNLSLFCPDMDTRPLEVFQGVGRHLGVFHVSKNSHMNARIRGFPPCTVLFTSNVSGINVVTDWCSLSDEPESVTPPFQEEPSWQFAQTWTGNRRTGTVRNSVALSASACTSECVSPSGSEPNNIQCQLCKEKRVVDDLWHMHMVLFVPEWCCCLHILPPPWPLMLFHIF